MNQPSSSAMFSTARQCLDIAATLCRRPHPSADAPCADEAAFAALCAQCGFRPRRARLAWAELAARPLSAPPLLILQNGNCVLLSGKDGEDIALLIDPLGEPPREFRLPVAALQEKWAGEVFLLEAAAPATVHGVPQAAFAALARCAAGLGLKVPESVTFPPFREDSTREEVLVRAAGVLGLSLRIVALTWEELCTRGVRPPFCFCGKDGQWRTVERGTTQDFRLWSPAGTQDAGAQDIAALWGEEALLPRPREARHAYLRALVAVARAHGQDLAVEDLAHTYSLREQEPDLQLFQRILADFGYSAHRARTDWNMLDSISAALPALLLTKNGAPLVLWNMGEHPDTEGGRRVEIENPLAPELGRRFVSAAEVEAVWDGDALFIKPEKEQSEAAPPEKKPFGFSFFVDEIKTMRGNFGEIGLAALVLHLIGLATPLFFQLIIDKVVTHHAVSTLQVLAGGMLAAIAFEGVFGWLRSYLMLHASSVLDLRLTVRTFEHLSGIGLPFFEKMPAGVLIKHMQQPEKVREFLTGRIFGTALDSLALVVLLPVLFAYSSRLALLVLGFSGLTALIMFCAMGPFRRRLHDLYNTEGQRQAFLVESIRAMPTVKSLSLEPSRRRSWNNCSALAAGMRFRVGKMGLTLNTVVSVIQKLMTVAILWWGVDQVFTGVMTVGALIAFNMYASRVSGPLVQMVGLIQQYQETRISLDMLGQVMNQPEEMSGGRGIMPPLKGKITIKNLTFRYSPDSAPALQNISCEFPAGGIIGIVGRSGSGKSTLLSLLQRLFPLQEGDIWVDGHNLRDIDMGHLRRSIGVILQNNFLFRGRVRDNIAVTRPAATLEEIMHAARVAAAHSFIEKLPDGYNTVLEEDGTNLSGGQRQRLAIARSLLTDPKIMIFDEATSALDPESEAEIQDNMKDIGQGRTMLIVSHRLSMLMDADVILVLDHGELVGCGTHAELHAGCPVYRNLWDTQNRHAAQAAARTEAARG